jgi:hypothetical protein
MGLDLRCLDTAMPRFAGLNLARCRSQRLRNRNRAILQSGEAAGRAARLDAPQDRSVDRVQTEGLQ